MDLSKINTFGVNMIMDWRIMVPLLIWVLIWKGIALWKAARSGHNYWFIILLLANSLGILEILYIFVIDKWLAKKGKR